MISMYQLVCTIPLAIQWLGVCVLTAEGPTPGWGTKILKATQQGQINKQKETVVVV